MIKLFHTLGYGTILWRPTIAALMLACLGGLPVAVQNAYILSPSDRVGLRIVAWDTIALDFVEYNALNGEYAIGPDGSIMVPLLGPVQAQGKNTTELAEELAAALLVRLGLVETPSVSIAILDYRPIYMLGAVRTPGRYAFSPGLTVQQALALAGGVDTLVEDGVDRLSTVIRTAGQLREIRIELTRQQIRAARLSAETQGLDGFDLPDALDHPDGSAAATAIFDKERALFQSRQDAQDRALAALQDSRTLLEAEIAALETKQASQTRQVALLREQVGNVETLVERGLARSPSFVAAQSQLIELENRQLDTETAVFRARQSIGELERDRVEIEASRRLAVLRELQDAEAAVARLLTRRNTTGQLLLGAEALLSSEDDAPAYRLHFAITRVSGEDRVEIEARPDTQLQPADVLEVTAVPDGQ